MTDKNPVRDIPSVDSLLKREGLSTLLKRLPREIILSEIRELFERIRREALEGRRRQIPSVEEIEEVIKDGLERLFSSSLKRVINATGVVIHTNLGRACLPDVAIEALSRLERSFINLEFDLKKGTRSERDKHLEGLICRLTGAEAAIVVNNNASALLLALNTLSENREVICSRGEFVEIGGSFRLPTIIEKSGCIIKAVGTTNRTHLSDYLNGITHQTGCILKVHPSNYRITGFTSSVGLKELVEIGRKKKMPVVEDLGSGALVDLSMYGLPEEPVVKDRIAHGVDIVTFSGDKLLGGPQAGIIVGKKRYIDVMKRNPLKRALRCGRLIIIALEATLRLYLEPQVLPERLPVFRFLMRGKEEIRDMSNRARNLLKSRLGDGYNVEVIDGVSEVGGGSMPTVKLPTCLISISHKRIPPHRIFRDFLEFDPPVIGRVEKDRFLLDLRCVEDVEDVCP